MWPPDPRSYPPSKTRYLTALLFLPLLLLAAVLTVYLAAGVRVKAWSLRVNSFVTLLFISALASPSTNLEGELLIPEDARCTNKSSERWIGLPSFTHTVIPCYEASF